VLLKVTNKVHVQAGLVLRQGNVPEKHLANRIAQTEHKIPIKNAIFTGGSGIDNLILYSV
jgi:hypothetical protein